MIPSHHCIFPSTPHRRRFPLLPISYNKKDSTPVFLDPSSRSLLVKRLLRKLATHENFVVAFGGHSSAAAHGNYYNQSYAHVFERVLAPAFEAAKIPLVVRNHAMGGTGSVPGSYCLGTVYGEDLDVMSWDFGMTEGNNIDHTDYFFRSALLRDRTPMVLLSHNTDNQREALLKYYAEKGFEVGGIRMNQAMTMTPPTTDLKQSKSLLFALQYLNCADTMDWDECKGARYDCSGCKGPGDTCPGQVSCHAMSIYLSSHYPMSIYLSSHYPIMSYLHNCHDPEHTHTHTHVKLVRDLHTGELAPRLALPPA